MESAVAVGRSIKEGNRSAERRDGQPRLREKCVTLVDAHGHLWTFGCSERAEKCCDIMPLAGLACMGCKGSSVRITPSRPLLKRKSPVGHDWAFLCLFLPDDSLVGNDHP